MQKAYGKVRECQKRKEFPIMLRITTGGPSTLSPRGQGTIQVPWRPLLSLPHTYQQKATDPCRSNRLTRSCLFDEKPPPQTSPKNGRMKKHLAYEREGKGVSSWRLKRKKGGKKKVSEVQDTLGIQDNMASRSFMHCVSFFSIHQTQIKNKGRKARNLKSSCQIMIHIPGIKRIHTIENLFCDKEQAWRRLPRCRRAG